MKFLVSVLVHDFFGFGCYTIYHTIYGFINSLNLAFEEETFAEDGSVEEYLAYDSSTRCIVQ
jgi:hypothetical protein